MNRYIIAVLVVLLGQLCVIKPLWSQASDNTTAAGPFPIFIGVAFEAPSIQVPSRLLSGIAYPTGARRSRGVRGVLGAYVGKRLLFEIGAERRWAWTKGSNESGISARLSSVRYAASGGYRSGNFPIGRAVVGGFVLDQSHRVIIDSTDLNQRSFHFTENQFYANGGIRLMVIDPVGTAGGFGFHLQFDLLRRLNRVKYNVSGFNPGAAEVVSPPWSWSLSFRLIIPLALRIV